MAIWAQEDPIYQPAMRVITAITNSNPAQVTTSFDHDFSTGLIVRIRIPDGYGMRQINGMFAPITVTAANTFTIDINTTGFDTFSVPDSYTWDDLFRLRTNENIGVIIPNSFAFSFYGLTLLSRAGATTLQWGGGVGSAQPETSVAGYRISAGFRNAVTAEPQCSVYVVDAANVDAAQWAAYVVGGAVPPGWAWLTATGSTPEITQPRCGVYWPTNYLNNVGSLIDGPKNLWLMPSVYGPTYPGTPNEITVNSAAIMNAINGLKATWSDYIEQTTAVRQFAQVVPIGEINSTIYLATKNVLQRG